MPISFDPNKSFLNRVSLPREIAPAGRLALAVGVGVGVSFFATPLAGAAASLAVLLAGCGSDKKTTNPPNSTGQTGGGSPGDVLGDTFVSCTSDEECMAPEHCVTGACTTLPTADDDVPADGGISADDDIPADDDDAPTAEEICNDLDEDGDGQTDESSASTPGQPIPLERTSGSGDGECRPVTEKCIRGEWVPLEPRRVEKPVETSCDDLDNDCDGETDEDFGTATCGIGACEKTIDNCVRGAFLLCDPMEGASDELCSDQIDNNCDGSTDEESAVDAPTWYRDADADAFGSSLESIKQCLQPSEFVANPLDCNDDNPYLNPASSEDCDGLDTNCTTPMGLPDVATEIDNDGDGYIECDPFIDHGAVLTGGGDCDDSKIAVNPAAVEICDSIDNNCDALTDDPSAADAQTWFADADHDNFGNPNISEVACSAPANHVPDNTDCNDDDANEHPGQIWVPDQDGDLYGARSSTSAVISCPRPEGHVLDQTDCLDSNPAVHPTAEEVCDGYDTDCSSGTAIPENNREIDNDGDGYIECDPFIDHGAVLTGGGDCDDTNPNTNPVANELSCDGSDNNCNADTDEIDERVPADFATIQSAIDASTAGAVICVSPGTYNERIRFNGKAVKVLGRDGAEATFLNGEAEGSVATFANNEGVNSILEGFAITNGNAEFGGGVYISNADPTLTRLILSGNHASQHGGGIYMTASDATLKNADIRSNSALYRGGALYAENGSEPVIQNLICAGNTAQMGGALTFYAGATTDLVNVTIFKNQAVRGGAVYLHYTNVHMTNGALVSNVCTYSNYCKGDIEVVASSFVFGYSNLWGNLPLNSAIPPTSNNISEDPLFIDTTSANPLLWDFHIYPNSPMKNTGDPTLFNPDDSRSDRGAYGGPNAGNW